MLSEKKLKLTIGLTAAALAVTAAPAGAQSPVCNEATEGQRGDYVATGDIVDPLPPARHKTELAPLPGEGGGLQIAAQRSPALTQCGPAVTDDGGGGGIVT